MEFTPENIRKKYGKRKAQRYDLLLPYFFDNWKRKAIEESSIKKEDQVLVFCCGTGGDFPHILEKIGREGKITGVDFSAYMLDKANEKIHRNQWENIELIEEDVTEFLYPDNTKFDAGICTLGLSIILGFINAFENLLSHVKKKGPVIIGDMKLATGRMAVFNPLTLFLSRNYGGTRLGHQNSLKLLERMKEELEDVHYKDNFFNSYYYCSGIKK